MSLLRFPFNNLDDPQVGLTWRLNELSKTGTHGGRLDFLRQCEDDIVYYANTCVNTVIPRKRAVDVRARTSVRPWFTCRRQAEALYKMQDAKENGYDLLWPKTRWVGMSWLHIIDDSHGWAFVDSYSSRMGHRNVELIDKKGQMDAAMPKFDFIYKHWPRFMHIEEYSGDPNDRAYKGEGKSPWSQTFLRVNPIRGGTLSGEAVTDDFGSGPRADKVTIDEFSKCLNAEAAWGSCGETSDCRNAIFTPKGKNYAWGLTFPDEWMKVTGKRQVERPRMFRVHWKDIPWLNEFFLLSCPFDPEDPPYQTEDEFEAWFADVKKRYYVAHGNGYSPFDPIGCRVDEQGIPFNAGYDDGRGNIEALQERRPMEKVPPRAISCIHPWRIRRGFRYDADEAAVQLDLSFGAKSGRKVYYIQLRTTKKSDELFRNPKYPLYAFCDPGRSSGNAFYLGWAQWNPEREMYEVLQELTSEGRSAKFFRAFLSGQLKHWKEAEKQAPTGAEQELFQMMQHPAWRVNALYGDPNGLSQQGLGADDTIQGIFEEGGIPVLIDHAHKGYDIRIESARRVLEYTAICPVKCPRLLMALEEIRFPDANDTGKRVTSPHGYLHHAQHSHPCAAYEAFACMDPHRFDRQQFQEDSADAREDAFIEEYKLRFPKASEHYAAYDNRYDNRSGYD